MNTEEEHGKVIRARLRSGSPRAMLIEFRLKDSDGMAMKLLTFQIAGENSVSELPSIESRIGEIFPAQFLIFPGGQ